jgi:hypothetical protein
MLTLPGAVGSLTDPAKKFIGDLASDVGAISAGGEEGLTALTSKVMGSKGMQAQTDKIKGAITDPRTGEMLEKAMSDAARKTIEENRPHAMSALGHTGRTLGAAGLGGLGAAALARMLMGSNPNVGDYFKNREMPQSREEIDEAADKREAAQARRRMMTLLAGLLGAGGAGYAYNRFAQPKAAAAVIASDDKDEKDEEKPVVPSWVLPVAGIPSIVLGLSLARHLRNRKSQGGFQDQFSSMMDSQRNQKRIDRLNRLSGGSYTP